MADRSAFPGSREGVSMTIIVGLKHVRKLGPVLSLSNEVNLGSRLHLQSMDKETRHCRSLPLFFILRE